MGQDNTGTCHDYPCCAVPFIPLDPTGIPNVLSCCYIIQEEYTEAGTPVGVDLATGEAFVPADSGVWDNYNVKRQLLHSW